MWVLLPRLGTTALTQLSCFLRQRKLTKEILPLVQQKVTLVAGLL